MQRAKRILAGLMMAYLALAIPALGQGSQTGGITGVVKDPQGAVVSGATVEVFSEATGRSERKITSDSEGNFSVPLLPPGNYRLDVTATNFKQHRAVGVPVRINETVRHDVVLEVGSVQDTVEVTATPTLINTVNATTGQPIDSRTLAALPLPIPNFLLLLNLSAGTAGELADVRAANRGIVDINVNGQRTSNNSVALEGINVNDFNLAHFDTIPIPNPNAIQEFKVATSLYDASLGSKGGGAVSLVLKSGTKDLHAQAYWLHRNDALNANEWFRNANGLDRARLLQNVVGASASGPVWKLGGNWFFNIQGVRARNGLDPNGSSLNPLIQAFPTASDGSTSASLLGSAFGLSPGQIDPVAVNILNHRSSLYGGTFLVPRPGQGGCGSPAASNGTFRCTFSSIAPLEDNQYTITYDRSMRDGKDRISGRWFWDNGEVLKPFGTATTGGLSFPRADVQRNRFLSISHTHLVSSRQVNEFRFGYNRFNSSFAPTDSVTLADIGATRPNESEVPGIYFFTISGLFSLGTGVNDQRGTISNAFQVGDTWSLTTGSHTFRAGGEASRFQLNRSNRFAVRGSLTFNNTTSTPALTAWQAFLTGRATTLQSGAGDPQRYFRATDVALFVQDDWKIRPTLTLNLGLRWEGLGFSREKFDRLGNFDPGILLQNPSASPFIFPETVDVAGFRGTPGVPGCVLNDCFDHNNFAPRISFAWDVRGDSRTVVRAGYGIYYQRLSNQNILQANLSPPFNVQAIESRPTGDPAGVLQNPFPSVPPSGLIAQNLIPQGVRFAGVIGDINTAAGRAIFINEDGQMCANFGGTAPNCSINLASFTAPPVDFYSPYTQQWNLLIQREVFKNLVVEAGYVGSHYVGGVGIFNPFLAQLASPSNPIRVTDINGVTHTITTNTVNNEALRHGIIGLSRVRGARFSGNIGHTVYHSGQLTVSRRFQNGLYFQGAYTFSKNIDNVSGSMSTDELNATRPGQLGANMLGLGNRHPGLNRGLSDFDRPHRLVVSSTWDIPIPRQGFLGGKVFQGWTLSGIITYQNGLPFSIIDPAGGSAFGTPGLSTPQLICAPLAQQISTLPGCTPGQPTTIAQALLTGRVQDRLTNFINPNFFSVTPSVGPGVTDYGNVPRNSFRAPFQQNWDLSLAKRFTFKERHSIQFRADAFNVWNHPVFNTPAVVSIATRSTFSQITTTAIPARLIQFGLKYEF